MENRIDLTKGHITDKLIKLALPIMGTSFIQMAYNMTDMLWIGRIGSNAVAAVGTAGFFTWLAMAFVMISKVGAEIKISQCMGRYDIKSTKDYIISAIQINLILAIIYSLIMLIFSDELISFFNLGDLEVISMTKVYLITVSFGLIFYFINPVLTAIFNGAGNSKTPFIINTSGLIFNMIFDPILILGWGPFPEMGVFGAAVATVLAQVVVTLCFIYVMIKSKDEYLKINLFKKVKLKYMKTLIHLGLPAAIQSGLFTLFSMILGRIVAIWGPVPIAVQKVGSQIEAISWMTAGGFSTALGTFVGQNYGARKYERIEKGYKITMILAIALGIFATILLVFAGGPIFKIFLSEKEALSQGIIYLTILGYSQLFMCIEITTTGAFNGLGRTYIPSIIGILLTGARVPMAYLLSKPNILGIEGVWWSITISSMFKGVVLVAIYIYLYKVGKLYLKNKVENKIKDKECG